MSFSGRVIVIYVSLVFCESRPPFVSVDGLFGTWHLVRGTWCLVLVYFVCYMSAVSVTVFVFMCLFRACRPPPRLASVYRVVLLCCIVVVSFFVSVVRVFTCAFLCFVLGIDGCNFLFVTSNHIFGLIATN